jgi:hypothetical protein
MAEMALLAKEDPNAASDLMAQLDPIYWVQWAGVNTEKSEPVEFVQHKPLEQIYREFHPNQVYEKASQIGMTATVINKLLWYSDYHHVTSIYTMPTATDIYQFSQQRFAPIIHASHYLDKRMGHVDSAMLKKIGSSFIFFRGAQKETQAISIPADIIAIDEYDFSNIDILDTFRKRLGASKLKWSWVFSTPTIPEFGINALFLQSDQRHWLVKCSGCHAWQKIDFWKNIFKKKYNQYFFGCYKCQKRLNRRNGVWVAKYPKRATDDVYDDQGQLQMPATGLRGYKVNPLTFTFKTATHVMGEWDRAKKKNRVGAIKNFYNFDLGEPYVSGETLITEARLRETMTPDYNHEGYNVLGADQGDILHWVIKHITPDGEKPIIAFGQSKDFEDIARKMDYWNCRVGVIDAMPNKHPARKLVQDFPRKMYMAYYKEQREEKKESIENRRKEGELYTYSQKETQAILLDRTETLDASAQAWIAGKAWLVRSKEHVDEEVLVFLKQMTSMKRDEKEDEVKGIVKAVWVKIGDDHYRHADNYANVASVLRSFGSGASISVGGSISSLLVSPSEKVDMSLLLPSTVRLR